jgi:hypothetical protein
MKCVILWTTEDDCLGGEDGRAKELAPTTDELQGNQACDFVLYSLLGVNNPQLMTMRREIL